jgi:rhamnosyltransferase
MRRDPICAVVVTYNPDSSFPDRLDILAAQVDSVLVVDNHSSPSAISMLRQVGALPNVSLIFNSANLGQASGLNIGIAQAIANCYDWALLLDQDTVPAHDMVDGLREVYEQFPDKDNLAIIGSNYRDPTTGEPIARTQVTTGYSWEERVAVINSGSLISLKAYKTVGSFRNEYFIDCVDVEYCLRARSKDFKVILTRKPLMVHGIGQPTYHRFLWKTVATSHHSPQRRYYLIRNHTVLAKEYIFREPSWMLASFMKVVKSMMTCALFENDRLLNAQYMVMGLADGICSNFDRRLS